MSRRAALVVVDVSEIRCTRIAAVVAGPLASRARCRPVPLRLRDRPRGLRVLDVTAPPSPASWPGRDVPEAAAIYVARTYAYVPAGTSGLAIVDVERPSSRGSSRC